MSWKKLEVKKIERQDPPVTVYRLSGLLTSSPESYAFLDMLRDGVQAGHKELVVSLLDVDHVTSAGVGILAACYASVSNAKGQICLAGISAQARTILDVVGLLGLLKTYEDEEEAVRCLKE